MAKRSSAATTLPDYWYTPYFTKYANKSEMRLLRQEYTRMRDIAQKRLSRLRSAGFTPREFKGGVPKLRDVRGNASQFARTMSDLYSFLKSPQSTVRGAADIRNRTLETLRDRGMSFVNESNLQQFGTFMELFRLSGAEKIFQYSDLGSAFKQVTSGIKGKSRKGINKAIEKAFRAYMKAEFGFSFRISKEDRPAWL